MPIRFSLALIAVLVAATTGHAEEYRAGELNIANPYARPTVAGQPSGAAYLSLENQGKQADRLVAASSPIAKTVEIHTMSMDGNVMRMREVANIELKPASKVAMQPGDGYHLMLMGLKKPLQAGDKFPLILTFEKAGKQEVTVRVEAKPATGATPSRHKH